MVPSQVVCYKKYLAKNAITRSKGIYVRDGTYAYAVWNDPKCVAVMTSENPGQSEDIFMVNVK